MKRVFTRLLWTILLLFMFTNVQAQYSRIVSVLTNTYGIIVRNDSLIFELPTESGAVAADSSWVSAISDTFTVNMFIIKSADGTDTTYIYVSNDSTIIKARSNGGKGKVKYDADVIYAGKVILQDTLQTLVIMGHDVTGADTFYVYDDGTNTIFKSDNPIKFETTIVSMSADSMTLDTLYFSGTSGALYSSVGSPGGNDSFVSLLVHSNTTQGDNTFTDSGQYGHVLTPASGAIHTTSTYEFPTSSMDFNLISARLTTPDHASFDIDDGSDFVIEFWYKEGAIAGTADQEMITHGDGTTNVWRLYYQKAVDRLRYQMYDASVKEVEIDYVDAEGLIESGNWVHVALVRSGNNYYWYTNGVKRSTQVDADNRDTPLTHELRINDGGDYFRGYMDEIRISKGTDRGYTGATITQYTVPFSSYAYPDLTELGAGARVDTLFSNHWIGHDATEVDTFEVWDDGTNTRFIADNPIKIEGTIFDDNSIYSSGGVGTQLPSAADTTFSWIPQKQSLVIGSATGTDFGNIESNCFIFGINNDMSSTANSHNWMFGQNHDTGGINDHNFMVGKNNESFSGDQYFTMFGEDNLGSAGGGTSDYSFVVGKTNTVQMEYMAVFGNNHITGTSGGNYGFMWGRWNKIEVNSSTSAAMGYYSRALSNGQRVFANGRFGAYGDAQYEDHILRITTTDAVATDMSQGGNLKSHAGGGDLYLYRIEARITAICVTGAQLGDVACYTLLGLVTDSAGSFVLKLETLTVEFEDQAAWDVAFDVSGVDIEITVTGAADNTITWVAHIHIVCHGDES